MKQYSFSELSKILGVTKNVVKYRMKKCPAEHLTKEDGIIRVNEDGLKWLKNQLKNHPVNQQKTVPENDQTDPAGSDPFGDPVPGKTDLLNDQIRNLNDQIDFLKSQIEVKDKQIEDLTASLKAEQVKNGLLIEQSNTILKIEADTKKSWFSRVFKRNK
jgi:hypothetical protein